jgi:hypothetical protein
MLIVKHSKYGKLTGKVIEVVSDTEMTLAGAKDCLVWGMCGEAVGCCVQIGATQGNRGRARESDAISAAVHAP